MGFIGSINTDLRAILAQVAPSWRGRAVYVGCSGNFTVERILSAAGVEEIHSSDVSLYTTALAAFITGSAIRVDIKDPRYEWLRESMEDPLGVAATVLLCTSAFEFADDGRAYHLRMWGVYRAQWKELIAKTRERITEATSTLRLSSYTPSDVVDFVSGVPEDGCFVSFPPTYAGGYEKLYAKIADVFDWDAPCYSTFDDARFATLAEKAREKAEWMTLRDKPIDDLASSLIGLVQTSPSAKPVYIYGSHTVRRLARYTAKVDFVRIPRLRGEIPTDARLALVQLSAGQLNLLRAEHLSKNIVQTAPSVALGVVVRRGEHQKLLGALGFTRSTYGIGDIYMLSDFPVEPTIYRRLSKLILAAAVSTEVQGLLETQIGRRVRTILTTAFTRRPSSMKYRGLFDVYNRAEDKVNYLGNAGRWSLQEGLHWWTEKHSKQLSS